MAPEAIIDKDLVFLHLLLIIRLGESKCNGGNEGTND